MGWIGCGVWVAIVGLIVRLWTRDDREMLEQAADQGMWVTWREHPSNPAWQPRTPRCLN